MIEEISPGFYHIQLPYTGSPLRNINVYVVKTDEKSLMIDSGADLEECRNSLADDRKCQLQVMG